MPVTPVARPVAPIKVPAPTVVSASVLTISVSKQVVAPAPMSEPMTVRPAMKVASVAKDSFMMRCFKLADTEESGALIINQVIEVSPSRVVGAHVPIMPGDISGIDDNDEENGDGKEDGEEEDDEEAGTRLDIDANFLKSLCLEEVFQESSMEMVVGGTY
ncbi:hypothetical protein C0995_016732 [Termitomyces sp. Mi166|nr:hypothetical protein C0995_016732 [Termitomyces sp. Mi166\